MVLKLQLFPLYSVGPARREHTLNHLYFESLKRSDGWGVSVVLGFAVADDLLAVLYH